MIHHGPLVFLEASSAHKQAPLVSFVTAVPRLDALRSFYTIPLGICNAQEFTNAWLSCLVVKYHPACYFGMNRTSCLYIYAAGRQPQARCFKTGAGPRSATPAGWLLAPAVGNYADEGKQKAGGVVRTGRLVVYLRILVSSPPVIRRIYICMYTCI